MEKDKVLNLLQNGLLPQVHGAYYEALKMAIDNWQPKLSEDCISRQAVLSEIETVCFSNTINDMVNKIEETVKQLEEKRLAKALEENDFFVGSHKALFELKQAFPDMKVYYSPGIDENKIFVIAHAELYPFERVNE